MVDTGAARFVVDTNRFTLFERVSVQDVDIVTTLGEADSLRYEDRDGVNLVGAGPRRAARRTQWTWDRQGLLYENYVNIAFEPNPAFDPAHDDPSFGNTTLQDTIRLYNFYGWQDYGDVPLDYEAFGPRQAGQMNLKYWYLYGMLVQFARSGDFRWLDLAWPAARHRADIDYLHLPDEGIQHWSHGAFFGHSNHDEPGNINPNRNSNSPSVDLFFGVPDLLLAYCLSGEHRYREVALEGLAADILAYAYRYTGRTQYLAEAAASEPAEYLYEIPLTAPSQRFWRLRLDGP